MERNITSDSCFIFLPTSSYQIYLALRLFFSIRYIANTNRNDRVMHITERMRCSKKLVKSHIDFRLNSNM